VDVDEINSLTGFDPADIDTFLEPDDFRTAFTLMMMREENVISAPMTFDELIDDYQFHDRCDSGIYAVTPVEMEELNARQDAVPFQPNPDDHTLGGVKQFLSNKQKRRTALQLHMDNAHVGYHPDCPICTSLIVRFNKTFKIIDRYVDPRPCFEFVLDMGTMSHRSSRGNKYFSNFKCPGSGWREWLFQINKNDFCDMLDDLLTTRRADTRFQYDGYKFMEQVYTDLDSVWSDVNKMVDGIRKKHGVKFIFACPTNKNKMAMGEKMIQDDEKSTKALMIQFRLPIQY
jgi:hypothetical protein